MGDQQDDDPVEREDRDELGRFAPGHRQLGHRRKGTPNKITQSIRERVLDGFNDDPRGDGITEFVKELKRDHPPAAAGLLSKILPSSQFEDEFSGTTINAEPNYETTNFIIEPIASANFFLPAGITVTMPDGRTVVSTGDNLLVDEETCNRLMGLVVEPARQLPPPADAASEDDSIPSLQLEDDGTVIPIRGRFHLPRD